MIPKLWVVIHQWVAFQFLVCHKTDELIVGKENILSPMETVMEWQVPVYSQVDECALIHFERQTEENATSPEWS